MSFLPPPMPQGIPLWLKIRTNLRGNSKSTTRFPTCCLFKLRLWARGFLQQQEPCAVRATSQFHSCLSANLSRLWNSYHCAAYTVYEWHNVALRCEYMGLLFVSHKYFRSGARCKCAIFSFRRHCATHSGSASNSVEVFHHPSSNTHFTAC